MAEIIFFQARPELNAKQNLSDFIEHCRSKLMLYEEQGGFSVNTWHFSAGSRKYAMSFSKYQERKNAYHFDPLDEPFLTFAKGYVRYTQSERQVKSVANRMMVLRLLHDALVDVHGEADILKADGLVLGKVRELGDTRYAGSDLLYRLGQQLELIYEFLRRKAIIPGLPSWANPWRHNKSKAERTDKDSRKWKEERFPSLHQMTAIADCFAKA